MTLLANAAHVALIHQWNDESIHCTRFEMSKLGPGTTMIDLLVKVGMFETKTRARKQGFVDETVVPGVHFFKKGRYLFEIIP